MGDLHRTDTPSTSTGAGKEIRRNPSPLCSQSRIHLVAKLTSMHLHCQKKRFVALETAFDSAFDT